MTTTMNISDLKAATEVGLSPAAVRFGLEDVQYFQMEDFFATTGHDPVLDWLIVRFVNITGARPAGVLNLDRAGLNKLESTVWLDDTGGRFVVQPVPDWFVDELFAFAKSRGSVRGMDKVFVKRSARGGFTPISSRQLSDMFARLRKRFEWADRQQVTAQTVRRYAIERMVNRFGIGVATTFAHIKPTYPVARPESVADALVELFGGDHPWLHRTPSPPQ